MLSVRALFVAVLPVLSFAHDVSSYGNVPPVQTCLLEGAVTVYVTVTVSLTDQGGQPTAHPTSPPGVSPVPAPVHPIPSQYSSCYDRNHPPFTYSHSGGAYHYSSVGSGSQGGENSGPTPSATKAPLTSYHLPYTTGKLPSIVVFNSTKGGFPTGTISKTLPSNVTSVSTLPLNTTAPGCQPKLVLDGVTESGFNKQDTPFSVKITTCSKFQTSNTTAFANFVPIDDLKITPDAIEFTGFSDDYVLLSIFALDQAGTPIIESYQLHFGSVDMPIVVLNPDGQPAANVLVSGNATTYPGVGQQCTTDASGKCSLTDLPPTTIGLVAKAGDNTIAIDGLAPTTGQVTLKLMPFNKPDGDSSFDINNGTSGWTGGTVSQSYRIKRDTTLALGTNGAYDLQSASNSFAVKGNTKAAYIKYKFITEEVPGGYFGSQYNDYYSVTIRSDTGASVTVTNSMNALGLGAFDANGATDWFTLSLQVPANTKSVQYDIGVSNVADNLLDSELVVGKVGDDGCDKCGQDCDACPSDPMCQDDCRNPPQKSCSFYRNCAESQLQCGSEGYPLGYGEKNCNRFVKNLAYFSPQGQDWIFKTMHCLQTAMVPVLQTCKNTCDSFQAAAFASHPACYVNSGFCGLQCPDIVAVFMTVNTDLVSFASLKQVVATGGLCVQNLLQTLGGCGGTLGFAGAVGGSAGAAGVIAGVAGAIAEAVVEVFLRGALAPGS